MKHLKPILPCIALIFTLTACHSRDEVSYSADPVTNVEALWEIIDTRYCYVEQKNVDWDTVRETYVAKAKKLQNAARRRVRRAVSLSRVA